MGKRTDTRQKRVRQKRNHILSISLGIGLMALGIVGVFLLPGIGEQAAAQNLSTIPVAVNFLAPNLELEALDGQTKTLMDYRDHVVLVNNWATWCPPCAAEMPTLVSFYNDHSDEGLMIVAIEAGEPKAQVQQFADQYQMPFPVWLDPDQKALNAFMNGSLPNSYVIDRSGTVRLTWTGEINREMLEKFVTPLLAENE